jgi:light-harvesting protein B-800-850 alpha chain
MIYGKIWLHVKPGVGIPVFLGAVAVSSFAVHVALVTNTTWVKRFLNGGTGAKAAMVEQAPVAMVPDPGTTVLVAASPQASK